MINFKNFKNIIKVLIVINFSVKLGESLNITEENGAELRIIGGEIADHKGTEHQVSIRVKKSEIYYGYGAGHICGGSIISTRSILTAAHCLYTPIDENGNFLILRSPKDLRIVMGILNLRSPNGVQRDVKSYYYHTNFSMHTMENDIAILFLSESIPNGNPNIRPIQINHQEIKENTTNCNVMGWGKLKNTGPDIPSKYLMIANVTIVDQEKCKSNYKITSSRIREGMMCAGSFKGDVDSCKGDSGGPLTYSNTLIGIVSWGYDCARPGLPGVYTNISYYADWINKTLSLEPNSSNSNLNTNFILNTKLFFIIIFVVIFNL